MPPAPHTSFTGIDYGHSEGLVVSLPVWSGLEFIQQLLKRLHNEFCTDIDDPLRMNLTNFVDHPAFPPAEASRSHLCHLRCRFICNFYWSIRCFWFYLQWALQLHRVSRPYSSAIENGLTCSVSHCKFSFLFLCWWFHNENSFLTRSDQVSGEDLTVSALSSTLPFPATPSHWRLEFIVMVTAVCIIHAGGGCKVDGQRLTGDTVRRALVGCNSVGLCYRYWRRLRYRIHTGPLFVCGLASFDCIMYSKTSDKPLERPQMAPDSRLTSLWSDTSAAEGCLQSYSRSLYNIHISQCLICFCFSLLDTSSHLPPELPTDRRTQEQANKQKYLRDKWAASVISALEMKRIECKDTSSV